MACGPEKLRKDASECALIRDLAADKAKREMFDRLASHLTVLADRVEQAMIEEGKPIDLDQPSGWRRAHAGSMARYDWVQILSITTLALTVGVICAVLLTL